MPRQSSSGIPNPDVQYFREFGLDINVAPWTNNLDFSRPLVDPIFDSTEIISECYSVFINASAEQVNAIFDRDGGAAGS